MGHKSSTLRHFWCSIWGCINRDSGSDGDSSSINREKYDQRNITLAICALQIKGRTRPSKVASKLVTLQILVESGM